MKNWIWIFTAIGFTVSSHAGSFSLNPPDKFIQENNKDLGTSANFVPSYVYEDHISDCYEMLNGDGTPTFLGSHARVTKTKDGPVIVSMDPENSGQVTIYNASGVATVDGGSCTSTAKSPNAYERIADKLRVALKYYPQSRTEIQRLKTELAAQPNSKEKVAAESKLKTQEQNMVAYWSNIYAVLKRCATATDPAVSAAAKSAMAMPTGVDSPEVQFPKNFQFPRKTQ